jgi:hypothetical protein
MDPNQKNLGAVAVAGQIKYELLERDASHVELRNTLQSEQSVVIDLEALRGIASILNKAARELEVS